MTQDRTDLLQPLCARGANLLKRNLLVQTLLHAVAQHNAYGVFDSILVDSLKNEADQQGNTALHYAVDFGYADLTAKLVNAGVNVHAANTRMVTPLHIAVRGGRADLSKLLLVVGCVDANKQDYNRNMALHEAILLDEVSLAVEQPECTHGEGKEVAIKSERLHVELAELLLSHGADANMENDTTGFSPLHQALRDGYEHTLCVLLAHDADADARKRSKCGVTPMHVATTLDAGPDVLKELLLHGTDPLEAVKSNEQRAKAPDAVAACQRG